MNHEDAPSVRPPSSSLRRAAPASCRPGFFGLGGVGLALTLGLSLGAVASASDAPASSKPASSKQPAKGGDKKPEAAPKAAKQKLQVQVQQAIKAEAVFYSSRGLNYNEPSMEKLQCGSVKCTGGCHHSYFCSAGSTLCYVQMTADDKPVGGGCIPCGGTHPDGVDQINCDGT